VQLKSRLAAVLLRNFFGLIRATPAAKGRMQREIMGGMSALGLVYERGAVRQSPASGAIRPGTRVARVTGAGFELSAGWRELLSQLREPAWILLTPDPETALAPAARYPWLTVRTVVDDFATTAPGPLLDPHGHLRRDLALTPGTWLLVRPDGYVAATGPGEVDEAITALHLTGDPHH